MGIFGWGKRKSDGGTESPDDGGGGPQHRTNAAQGTPASDPSASDPSASDTADAYPFASPDASAAAGVTGSAAQGGWVDLAAPVRAEQVGDLGSLPDGLPPGALVYGRDPYDGEADLVPVAWWSSGPGAHGDHYRALLASYPQTGLWPLALPAEGHEPPTEDVLGGPAPVAEVDLTLDGLGIEPADGLPVTGSRVPVPTQDFWLALVPAGRPADVPAALGWLGPANDDIGGAEVSAVLRSWEDRYGALVFAVGFDTLVVALPDAPPDHLATALAEEHYAFCPDNVDQGSGSVEAYLPEVRRPVWSFWWD